MTADNPAVVTSSSVIDRRYSTNPTMRLRLLVGIVSAALFVLGFYETAMLQPGREKGLLPTEPPTPYIHYLSSIEPHRRALVVHGLDSNKEFMQIFCSALA